MVEWCVMVSVRYGMVWYIIDCLQSAFSLKIGLVLISSSAIANHDVIITIRDWDKLSFLEARGFAARVLRFRKQ